MASISDLMAGLYDLLAATYGVGDGQTYLQFGWPGYGLSPADFKDPANPNAGYDAGYAEEQFSGLANLLPAFSTVAFIDSGITVSEIYEVILSAATALNADFTAKTISDAQYAMVSMERGSRSDPAMTYYPCKATPSDWYTEASAVQWPTISVKSSTTAARPQSTFLKLGGQNLLAGGILKIKPANIGTLSNRLQLEITKRQGLLHKKLADGRTSVHGPTLSSNAAKAVAQAVSSLGPKKPPHVLSILDSSAALSFKTLNSNAGSKLNVVPRPIIDSVTDSKGIKLDLHSYRISADRKLTPETRIVLQGIVNDQFLTQPISPDSNGFEISFKGTLVHIDRAWLNMMFLRLNGWYLPQMRAGNYSNGTVTNNSGLFTMLPVAFIAARDLKIAASWSQQDKTNLAQAGAFGPFDVSNSSFDQTTLSSPGLQIIGWISKLTPILPPASDPTVH